MQCMFLALVPSAYLNIVDQSVFEKLIMNSDHLSIKGISFDEFFPVFIFKKSSLRGRCLQY